MAGTTLTLTPDGFRGRVLGKYEVLCRLSTGGMAEIFLAAQRGLAGFRKIVVLKQILPDIRGEEEFVRMFLDEAKVTAAFNHPHIAHVYDLDVADGELFLAMEFVPGATLVEVARACRSAHEPIPMGLSLMAVRDTAVALNYAHSFTDPLGRPSPVVHRDIAEKNIMVTYEGVTKLLDFGIAKSLARAGRTQVGMVKGTSGYMSPEQIMGDPLDARSDLFSLGVVLHECLTGMRLFYAKSAEAMMNAVLSGDVTPPSRVNKEVPPELDAIVLKALARRREDRYGTTLEFARAIERAVGPRIWHPEQSSELMLRLFAERRDQTRLLLIGAQSNGDGTSSETQVAQVIARGGDMPDPVTAPLTPPPPRAPAAPAKAPAPAKASPAPTSGAGGRRNTTEELAVRKPPAPPSSRRVSPPTETLRPPPPTNGMAAQPDDSEPGVRTQPALPPVMLDSSLRITASQVTTSPGYVEGETILTPLSRVGAQPPEEPKARPPAFVPPPDEPRARGGREPEEGRARSAREGSEDPRPRAGREASEEPRPRPPREAVNVPPEEARPKPPREAFSASEDSRPRPPREAAHGSEEARARSARDAAHGAADDARARSGRDASNNGSEDSRPRPPRDASNTGSEDSRPRPSRSSTQDSLRVTQPHQAPQALMSDHETAISRVPSLPPEEAPEKTPAVRRSPSSRRKQTSPPARVTPARASGRPTEPHEFLPEPEAPRRRTGIAIVAGIALLGIAGLCITVALGLDGGRVSSLWSSSRAPTPGANSSTTSPPPAEPEARKPEPTGPAAPVEPPAAVVEATPAPETAPSDPAAPPSNDTDDAETPKAKTRTPLRKSKSDPAAPSPRGKSRTAAAPADDSEADLPAPDDSATEAAAPQGFLTLITEPSARVSLAGRSLGETPLTKVALPVGRHTLKLMDGTGRPLKLLVEIKPDDTTSVRVPLEMLANP
ncbi:PEGA domain-containing protein [Corallococcus interemptor]|uniref:PEGA domain-containing protein n=2 Tax=Corallococcus TaxID=83461 RepID=A0A3A8PNK0_9BACT|nr:serine/threonine-protein kinase [Corallococcus interemptor]RKH57699.1 PEGA domain-containing protein [Corallococcus interemptor]